jgi:hypothetical protein
MLNFSTISDSFKNLDEFLALADNHLMRDMRVEDDLAANVEQNEGGIPISNCMLLRILH